jgi:hypothetical protein
MLSPDGQSDRFLIAKDFKRAGGRRDKFVFCYVVGIDPVCSLSRNQPFEQRAANSPKEPSLPFFCIVANGCFGDLWDRLRSMINTSGCSYPCVLR